MHNGEHVLLEDFVKSPTTQNLGTPAANGSLLPPSTRAAKVSIDNKPIVAFQPRIDVARKRRLTTYSNDIPLFF